MNSRASFRVALPHVAGAFAFLLLSTTVASAQQTCYDGVCFPQGDVSFADYVVGYDSSYSGSCGPTHPNFVVPSEAVGAPDYSGGSSGTGAVSLGDGGLLEVGFQDNLLTNSASPDQDLYIFEVGPQVESMDVALRPADAQTSALLIGAGLGDANGDGFHEVGMIGGATSGLDLDAWAPGFAAGILRFDAVQLVDVPGGSCGDTPGADIDAVGAIETLQTPSPGTVVCGSLPNSTGLPGLLFLSGSVVIADDDLKLVATQIPPGRFGYFLTSRTIGTPFTPPGSQGEICLSGNIGRYNHPSSIGQGPFFSLEIDLQAMPINPPTPALAGETWNFQAWYRDVNPNPTSNFTDAREVVLL